MKKYIFLVLVWWSAQLNPMMSQGAYEDIMEQEQEEAEIETREEEQKKAAQLRQQAQEHKQAEEKKRERAQEEKREAEGKKSREEEFFAAHADIAQNVAGFVPGNWQLQTTINFDAWRFFLSPDGSLIAVTMYGDAEVFIFRTSTGQLLKKIPLEQRSGINFVKCIFNKSATIAVIVVERFRGDDSFYIVPLHENIPPKEIRVIFLGFVAFNPLNEQEIVCGDKISGITIRDSFTGAIKATFAEKIGASGVFCFSHDSRFLAYLGAGSQFVPNLQVFDIARKKLVWRTSRRYEGFERDSLSYSYDDSIILLRYNLRSFMANYIKDQSIHSINAKNGKQISSDNYFDFPNLTDATHFYLNNKGTLAILYGKEGILYFWDVRTQNIVQTLSIGPSGNRFSHDFSLTLSDDDSTLAIDRSGKIYIYKRGSYGQEAKEMFAKRQQREQIKEKPDSYQVLTRKINNFLNETAKNSPLRIRDYLSKDDSEQTEKYLQELKAAITPKRIAEIEHRFQTEIVHKYRAIKKMVDTIQEQYQKDIAVYGAQLQVSPEFVADVIRMVHKYRAEGYNGQKIIQAVSQKLLQQFLLKTVPNIQKEFADFLSEADHKQIKDDLARLKKTLDDKEFDQIKERLAQIVTLAKTTQRIFIILQARMQLSGERKYEAMERIRGKLAGAIKAGRQINEAAIAEAVLKELAAPQAQQEEED